MTPCSLVENYHLFGRNCCPFVLKTEVAFPTETFISQPSVAQCDVSREDSGLVQCDVSEIRGKYVIKLLWSA
jgi:hypothetical protein